MNMSELLNTAPYNMFYDFRSQLQRFVYGRSEVAFDAGDAARDAVKTQAELEERRDWLRGKFIEGLGGLPSSETPLNAKVVGVVEQEGLKIEKIIFESRPGAFVTANLYIPDGVTSPRGTVLFLCGHHELAKHVPEYQTVCQYLARAGLVVMAQDPVGQGERFSYYEPSLKATTVPWGVPEHSYVGAQCLPLGDSIARYFAHDAMRGVDYLMTRKEVDPEKIGVTGNSGGGTQSCLMMVCDPRIAAAVPTTFVMSRREYMFSGGAQDAEQIWPGMTALGFDHEDVLLMMTPKPVRVQAVTSDFFPIEGTRRTVQRCKRLWEMYGKGDCVDMVEDFSTHIFTPTLAKSAAEFFTKHLLGRQVTPKDEDVQVAEPSRLWCTSSGQTKGEIPGVRFVYEENQDRLAALEREKATLSDQERKDRALTWLQERVFNSRKQCDLNPRYYLEAMVDNLQVQMAFWWSQEGVLNHAFLFRDFQFAGKALPVTLAVWDGGTTCLLPHSDWIRKTCAGGRAAIVLDVSGIGHLLPHAFVEGPDPLDLYGAVFKAADDLVWLNDSLPAMRTYDVLRTLDLIQQWPNLNANDVRAYANGRYGVYLQFAAGLDKRIRDVEIVGGIGSYTEWVKSRHYESRDAQSIVLPGMLKYLDLPDLERWRRGE
jgi:hypothetical protein